MLPYSQWRDVRTTENLANLLTRGTAVSSLVNNRMWISRPDWLSQPVLIQFEHSLPDEPPEVRKVFHVFSSDAPFNESLITLYSNCNKLIRII